MSLAPDIIAMVKSEGRAVTLRRVSGGTYTPATDTTSGATTTNVSTKALVLGIKAGMVDGSVFRYGDKRVVLPGDVSMEPAPGDFIVDGSTTYRVLDVKKVQPGAVVAGYSCHARAGA